MKIINSVYEYHELCKNERDRVSGFVPTMGALHEGHLDLIRRAKTECETLRVSIFVNPTQFNNPEDFEKYPQTLEQDKILLEKAGVDTLWVPHREDLYADNYRYQISEKDFSQRLCGRTRPGHFEGVLSVVMKLLQVSKAHKAYFGEKDYQQLQLVRGMCEAFFVETEIVACPIVRDSRGLALSSRLKRLSDEGLEKARQFSEVFSQTNLNLEELKQKLLLIPGLQIDYIEEEQGRRFAAVFLENVRLIDNRAKELK